LKFACNSRNSAVTWDINTHSEVDGNWSICNEQDLECVGSCFGIIGVIEPISGLFPKILVIKRSCKVGTLPDDKEVFRIDEVSLLEIAADGYVAGDLCRCHKHGGVASSRANANIGKSTLINTIGSFKLATNSLKNATAQAAVIASQVRPGSKKDPRDPSRLERKICDEILKLFHGTNSFYFSPTGDITKAVARQKPGVETQEECEDRFFWNKALLSNTSGFALEGLDGFALIIDDLLVFVSSVKEHNKRLKAVMQRAREKGIRFDKGKCHFCVTSVIYFGHVISKQGMQPNPKKVKAINEMPTPSSPGELTT
ncbi:hypothetical protein QYM36_008197, partial [Artemia franciscana]